MRVPDNENIATFINSYSGYHALALHFTIYLAFELIIQFKPLHNNSLYIIFRDTKFKYITKHIFFTYLKTILFITIFYLIFYITLIFNYNYSRDFLLIFIFYIPLMVLIYSIFNLIMNILQLIFNNVLISTLTTMFISISIYYINPFLIMEQLELFENIYNNTFQISNYFQALWLLLLINLLISLFYIYIFLKKDLIFYEEL